MADLLGRSARAIRSAWQDTNRAFEIAREHQFPWLVAGPLRWVGRGRSQRLAGLHAPEDTDENGHPKPE
jgi:hypothetical protein